MRAGHAGAWGLGILFLLIAESALAGGMPTQDFLKIYNDAATKARALKYMDGIQARYLFSDAYLDLSHGQKRLCKPMDGGIDNDRAALMVSQYVLRHPAGLQHHLSETYSEALIETFQCSDHLIDDDTKGAHDTCP